MKHLFSVKTGQKKETIVLLGIMIAGLVLRLLHLASTPGNPRTYQPGADEEFYIRFGMSVAEGNFGLTPDFLHMDPLYGYLLGGLFALFGKNLFIVYLTQTLIDTTSLFLVYLVGKNLTGNCRAGLLAASLYAVTATALFYSTTVLKPNLVAFYILLWLHVSLIMWQTKTRNMWVAYGILLGFGVALRSNLLLLAVASIVIVPLANGYYNNRSKTRYATDLILLIFGLGIALSLLAYRVASISDHWTFLPPNGGVVLHQVYNKDNPKGLHGVPAFVTTELPGEIRHAYHVEAERRHQDSMSAYQMSSYWRQQALIYLANNPVQSLKNILRKTIEFTAYKEIPNNRAISEDEHFSKVLAFLPRPFGWLIAFGLPGIVVFTLRSPKGWLLLTATATLVATFAIFYALSRFRFPVAPLLAIGSGITIDLLLRYRQVPRKTLAGVSTGIILLVCLSTWSSLDLKEPDKEEFFSGWAWGFLKMGDFESAQNLNQTMLQKDPNNFHALEFSAYLASIRKDSSRAVKLYRRALDIKPDSHALLFDYAIALEQTNNLASALAMISQAILLREKADYLFQKALLLVALEQQQEARKLLHQLTLPSNARKGVEWKTVAEKAQTALDRMRTASP